MLNNVAVIPALAKVNRLSIEMRSEAAYVLRENSAAGKHCHSKAEFDTECPVRLRAHGVQSLELSARAQAARQRQPDAARRLSCLAAGTAETEHGGS